MKLLSTVHTKKRIMISILLILFISSLTECRWILEIELLSYNNPTSERLAGQHRQCCDGGGTDGCNNECDNAFVFCLTIPDNLTCIYGRYQTGLVAENDDSLTFGDTIGSNNIPNPLIFNGTEWPNNNQLVLETNIFDCDGPNNCYQIIGGDVYTIILSPTNESFINYTATGFVFTLQMRYRFGCANFYYGSRCEVFCQPHNDDNNGHYTCDTQGNIVCNTGYQMNETNCTTPTLATSNSSPTTYTVATSNSSPTTVAISSLHTAVATSNSPTTVAISSSPTTVTIISSTTVATNSSTTTATTINSTTVDTTQSSSTVTGIAVGVVIPILLLLIAIAVVIAVVILVGKRRAHQTKGNESLDNPTYSTNDAEVSNNYYVMPQDEARYVRNLDNSLYESDTMLPGVNNTGPSNYSRLHHSEPELHSEIQPPNYSEIPPYNNYSMLSNYSEVQDYSVDINSSQEPLYSLADAPINDGTTLADLPEGHYEVDPNFSK